MKWFVWLKSMTTYTEKRRDIQKTNNNPGAAQTSGLVLGEAYERLSLKHLKN